MSAGCAPRARSMWRSTPVAAKFIRPPSNQRGRCTPPEMSRTRVYGRLKRRPRSRTTWSQYQSGSATLRRCSSSSELTPSERMKRASRVRSAYAGVGRQTISLLPVSVIRSSREGSVLGRGLLGQRARAFCCPHRQGRHERQDQCRIRERDQPALARGERIVPGRRATPALHRRPETDDPGDEEDRRAGRNALEPHGHGVTHLVDEDQQHEAGCEQPAPLERVRTDREQHGPEGLELHQAGEEAEDLGLAEDEEQAGPGGTGRGPAGLRGPFPALGRRLLQALEDGSEVLGLAVPALGPARLDHADGSLIGRGMNHASYMMIARNTSFMMPKFAAMTL